MFEGMDPYLVLLIFSLAIIAVSLLGAYLPAIKELGERRMHLMVALSAGIFIGILFFMLLPETFEEATDAHDAVIWILVGFLIVLFIDVLLKQMHMNSCKCGREHDPHNHELISFSAFAGLAIHAAIDGMLLSVSLSAGDEVGLAALAAIAIHKFVEIFSLSSTFMLTKMGERKSMMYLSIFALITPVAAFVTMPLVDLVSAVHVFIPLAIATGTFMYVGIYSLLPEAFHVRKDSLVSFALVIIGIVIIAVLSTLLGHGHVH